MAVLQGQEPSAETEGGDEDDVASYLHEKQHEARKGGQKMCSWDEVGNWLLDDIGVIHRRHEDLYHISRLISFH